MHRAFHSRIFFATGRASVHFREQLPRTRRRNFFAVQLNKTSANGFSIVHLSFYLNAPVAAEERQSTSSSSARSRSRSFSTVRATDFLTVPKEQPSSSEISA